jgi:enoyl-CoA hydratase/carnithine racemase
MSELLLVERQGHICTLTMNRAEKHNSVNPEMLRLMGDTFDSMRDDPQVRVVILRGVGDRAFSSGFDIGRIDQQVASGEGSQKEFYYASDVIKDFPVPVIAMIHGICMGGGLEIALSCDMRIAADDARLCIPPARLGVVYRPEGILKFINAIGAAHTREMFFTARVYNAARSYEMGLLDYVVPKAELESFTYSLAGEITNNAPLSVKGIKRVINLALSHQALSAEAKEEAKAITRHAAHSEDVREGTRAFLEKRKPQFQGR